MEYTLRWLYDKLGITLAELSRRSGISDVTLASIRDGKSARRSTINTLLRTFSDIYGVELSTDNVSGIVIKDKLARSEYQVSEKAEKAPDLAPVVPTTKAVPEKAPKRVVKQKKKVVGLPDGCITATEFARNHGREPRTFYDDMTKGLGPGLIGEHTDTIPERDHVAHETRPKPGRPHETERYLTQEQQHQALEFWKRHDVSFGECNDIGCWCHTVLKETE